MISKLFNHENCKNETWQDFSLQKTSISFFSYRRFLTAIFLKWSIMSAVYLVHYRLLNSICKIEKHLIQIKIKQSHKTKSNAILTMDDPRFSFMHIQHKIFSYTNVLKIELLYNYYTSNKSYIIS